MIEQIAVKGYDDNFSYVVHDGSVAAVVDPSGDIEKVFACIGEKNLKPVAVFITHSHFDHHDKIKECLVRYPVPVYAHSKAKSSIQADNVIGIEEGSVIEVGSVSVKVFYTPGHNDDSVCFYIPEEKVLITGDTLFVEGCGRVSGERDAEIIYKSLERIKALPDDTQVFPGHDYGSKPSSTIAWEKEHNRFFLAKNLEEFKAERL